MEPSTTVRRSARARKAKVAEADWEDIDLSDLDEQIKPQKAKSQKAKPKAKPKAKGKAKRKADDMEEEEEDEEKQPAAIVIKGEPLVQEEVAFQDHSHALEQSFEFVQMGKVSSKTRSSDGIDITHMSGCVEHGHKDTTTFWFDKTLSSNKHGSNAFVFNHRAAAGTEAESSYLQFVISYNPKGAAEGRFLPSVSVAEIERCKAEEKNARAAKKKQKTGQSGGGKAEAEAEAEPEAEVEAEAEESKSEAEAAATLAKAAHGHDYAEYDGVCSEWKRSGCDCKLVLCAPLPTSSRSMQKASLHNQVRVRYRDIRYNGRKNTSKAHAMVVLPIIHGAHRQVYNYPAHLVVPCRTLEYHTEQPVHLHVIKGSNCHSLTFDRLVGGAKIAVQPADEPMPEFARQYVFVPKKYSATGYDESYRTEDEAQTAQKAAAAEALVTMSSAGVAAMEIDDELEHVAAPSSSANAEVQMLIQRLSEVETVASRYVANAANMSVRNLLKALTELGLPPVAAKRA